MHPVVPVPVGSCKLRQNSFTLVELLVVIAIIGILVAITLQAASGVMQAAARARAKTEIQAMTTALEGYKNDNGVYPQVNTMNTNNSTVTPTYSTTDGTALTTYIASSQVLYQALSGKTNYLDTPLSGIKSYGSFKVNQLGNATVAAGTTGTAATYIQDPWSYSIGYNTGTGTGVAAASQSFPYNGNGFFDLWSSGGLTLSSKPPAYMTNTATWITSWQ